MQGFTILSLVAVLAIFGWMDSDVWAGGQSTSGIRQVSTPHEHYWVIEVGGKEVKHGLYREWYDNGRFKAEYTYDHGRKTGPCTEWYANGRKSAEGQYANGKDGVWTQWEKSGDIRSRRRYQNGKVVKQ